MSFFIKALTNARKIAKACIMIGNFILEVCHVISVTRDSARRAA